MDAPRMKVGKFYSVPCIFIPNRFHGDRWVPTLGPKHTDAELNFLYPHFHIDWRFASKRMFDAVATTRTPLSQVITNDAKGAFDTISLTGEPVLKRRMMRREMPTFPAASRAPWPRMEAAQMARCAKLKDGHICPHRGIDLRPFERPDGTAICPGHGLHWNLRTGELLVRHGAAK